MNLRLILADDHQLVREALRALLEKEADLAIVGEAPNGRVLLHQTAELQPDMVIMDIGMPVMDGITATRRLHTDHPSVKVIVLSMFCNRHYTQEALAAGASAFILKASAGEHLLQAVRAVSQNHRYLSPNIAALLSEESGGAIRPLPQLGRREFDVLQLLADGLTSKEIAKQLHISPRTAETHRRNIMKKLNIGNLAELVKYAIRQGLTFY
jgi:DNA-binding NarL/FixJ family response regulator